MNRRQVNNCVIERWFWEGVKPWRIAKDIGWTVDDVVLVLVERGAIAGKLYHATVALNEHKTSAW